MLVLAAHRLSIETLIACRIREQQRVASAGEPDKIYIITKGGLSMNMPTLIMACFMGLNVASSAIAGESRWRDCRTCHAVVAPDGTELARGGRSGPNLYGIANRPLAGDSAFRFYSSDLRAAGAAGLRWTEDNFVAYLADPDQFLQSATENQQAQSGMHVQLRSNARELYAYLRALSN